jgi:arabinofuranosyltransferase
LALADPLLSRLPMATEKDYRIGHYPRVFPRGYRRSLKIRANDLEDVQLREYLDKLWLVVRGPIWSADRWRAIWHFNLGHYDHLIDRDFYRKPSRTMASLSEFQNSVQDSSSFMTVGQTLIYEGRPLRIELEDRESFPSFTIELYGPHKYLLKFWKGRKLLDSKVVYPTAKTPYTLLKYKVSTPEKAMTGRFDAITVESKEECGYFSIGQLLPGEE